MDHRKRIPKYYDGVRPTGKHIADLLPGILDHVGQQMQMRPEEVLAAWPAVIGGKLASMTKAVSFHNGVLTVKVNNSTLYSLLAGQEKMRLLAKLRGMFPQVPIQSIYFCI